MKKLIIYDHRGEKQLEFDVYVEGQDFKWQSPNPQAFWLGEIVLVDAVPEETTTSLLLDSQFRSFNEISQEEVIDESKTVDNQGIGDAGVSESVESESTEGLSERPSGG